MPAGGTWADTPAVGFTQADTTITGPGLRVKISGDHGVTLAGATDDTLGVALNPGGTSSWATANDEIAVQLLRKQGTIPMVANGVIAQNADVFAAASGKVSATPSGQRIGFALEAASGDGSIFEVCPTDNDIGAGHPTKVVTVKTASYQCVAADFGSLLVANGAAEVDFTLPAPAAATVGAVIEFANQVDQIMGILPKTAAADAIANGTAAASLNSCKFSTASHKIGAAARATQINATTWLIQNLSDCTMTIA